MIIKQTSVFIENRPGSLAEITDMIAKNGINLRALSLAETSDSGILRIITDNADTAKVEAVLKENRITGSVREVLSVLVDDRAGGLAGMLKVLAGNNIAVKYMYAFVVEREKACIIMRIGEKDIVRAAEILASAGYEGLAIE